MKNPAVVAAIVVALITGSLGPISVSVVQERQEAAREERRVETGVIDTETLLGHSLFTHADTWTSLIIPQTAVDAEARHFLDIKFTAFQDSLLQLVEETDFNSLSNEQFHSVVSENLNQTVSSYLAEARREGISEAFLERFTKWHQRVVMILVSSVESSSYSPIFPSNNARMFNILTAYESALSETLLDVAVTLGSGAE